MNSELSNPENPERLTRLKLGHIKKVAGGIPAVLSSFKHAFGEAGVIRGWTALWHLNKKGGFDCPSCAWPDPDDERSGIAEYCENGAKAVADEATTKSLQADFFAKHSIRELSELNDYQIGKKGQVAEPMYLPEGAEHYQPISWEDAFKKIASHLNNLSNPNEAVFYTSGRTSNEAAYLYQLFTKEYGTNNLPDCSNMCHESSGFALSQALGIGKGSVKLEDFYEAEVIIIIGQNPGTNHPRMLTALQKGRNNGATIISVNPLRETGLIGFSNPQKLQGVLGINTKLTDLFLQVKLNGDHALLKALIYLLTEEEELHPGTVFDREFIENHTAGSEAFLAQVKKYDLDYLAEIAGVPLDQIKEAASFLKHKSKIIICW